jgi:hypothetical protein
MPSANPPTTPRKANEARSGLINVVTRREKASLSASRAGCLPGGCCGRPMPRSIELKKCKSFSRRTSRVFQVIAIEIENEPAVRTQCGHWYGT